MSIIVKGINYPFQINSFGTVTLNLYVLEFWLQVCALYGVLAEGLYPDGVNSRLKLRNAVSW